MKNIRNLEGYKVLDPSSIDATEHNDPAGSRKVSEVGRHLLPIPYINAGVPSYTTDATTIRRLPKKGCNLAIYNNSATLYSATLGEASSQASLAAGATDATGHVGIPCQPASWTYIACAESDYVITSNAALLVFIIDDDTFIKQEASR